MQVLRLYTSIITMCFGGRKLNELESACFHVQQTLVTCLLLKLTVCTSVAAAGIRPVDCIHSVSRRCICAIIASRRAQERNTSRKGVLHHHTPITPSEPALLRHCAVVFKIGSFYESQLTSSPLNRYCSMTQLRSRAHSQPHSAIKA
jgi:hypothetical protein